MVGTWRPGETCALPPLPALKVRGKVFAWISPHADALALHVDPAERPLMLESQPDLFYVIPHYAESAIVLVRLDAVQDLAELRDRVEESWLLAPPPALARDYGARAKPDV